MDMKKTAIATVAGFVLQMGGSYLLHSVILMNSYMATADLWRTEDAMGHRMWVMIVAQFFFVLGAVLDLSARRGTKKSGRTRNSLRNFARDGEYRARVSDRVRHRSYPSHNFLPLGPGRRRSVRAARNTDRFHLPAERFSGIRLFDRPAFSYSGAEWNSNSFSAFLLGGSTSANS